MSVYMQYATLTQDGDRHVARAWVKELEPHEVHESDDGIEVYTHSRQAAWAACEAALQRMATECLREAAVCRRMAAHAGKRQEAAR